MSYTLILGNQNYSSWSLRAWLTLRMTGAPFEQVVLDLAAADIDQQKAAHTKAGRVPVLRDGDRTIWDSLAITEYLAERHPGAGIWPSDDAQRAWARCLVAEMHSSFVDLRGHWPMNIRERFERPPTDGVRQDIARIELAWDDALAASGGPFLFGDFCAADAFFAPVVTRFATYGADVNGSNQAYMDRILAHELMQEWIAAAKKETWRIPKYEFD